MANEYENTKNLMKNRKARNRVFLVGFILFAAMAIGLMYAFSGPSKPKGPPPVASVTPPPAIASIPGTSNSPEYNRLVQQANDNKYQQAVQQQGSALPTLSGTSSQGLVDPMAVAPAHAATVAPPPVQPVAPPTTQMPRANTVTNVASNDTSRDRAYSSAQRQMELYLTAFKLKGGASEFSYFGQRAKNEDSTAGGASGTGTGATGAAGDTATAASKSASKAASFVRAGTVIPAVLITPVNSDTPGPIMAEVTSGPLKGARLLGTFRSTEDQVVLQFNLISMLDQPGSFQVQAYGVDQTTSAPGLATDVNHHYLRKYGLLAASAFVSGYGQAVSQQGSTTVVSPFGGATVVNPGLDNGQITKVALGQVGTQIGQQVSQESSRIRPTIKVQDSKGNGGVPIGILFMSDF
jgi:intracellular multiplication protein IcmE